MASYMSTGLVNNVRCEKNPGHKEMTPVSDFSLDDIPAVWRCTDMYCNIVGWARRVVKISVPYVSTERPPGYPQYNIKGKQRRSPMVGSGYAVFSDEVLPPVRCPIPHCPIVGDHQTTAPFRVRTARNVVFDDSEAKRAKIEFLYDSTDPSTSSVIEAEVVRVDYASSLDTDNIFLTCVSHNLDLIQKLSSNLPPRDTDSKLPLIQGPRPPLVMVISHPHGLCKHISFGDLVRYDGDLDSGTTSTNDEVEAIEYLKLRCPNWETEGVREDDRYWSAEYIASVTDLSQRNPGDDVKSLKSITYTAATCPGSSGGLVLVFTEDPPGSVTWAIEATHFRHRGGRRNASGGTGIKSRHVDCLSTIKKDGPKRPKRQL